MRDNYVPEAVLQLAVEPRPVHQSRPTAHGSHGAHRDAADRAVDGRRDGAAGEEPRPDPPRDQRHARLRGGAERLGGRTEGVSGRDEATQGKGFRDEDE